MEQAVRDGAKTFDFLRGAEEYKHAWGARDRMNRRRVFFQHQAEPGLLYGRSVSIAEWKRV